MSGIGDPEDDHVIAKVLDGQIDEFNILVERYSGYLFTVVSGFVPYDMVQEIAHDVFIEAYRSLAGYERGGVFKKWLSGIALHRCYDYLRRRYRRKEIPMSCLSENHMEWAEAVMAGKAHDAFIERQARKEAGELLQWAMASLCPEERMVLTLVHLDGLSVKETAEIMGWSVVSVRVRAHRSRKKLRKRLSTLIQDGEGI